MSASSLFSSPSKEAQQAASSEEAINQGTINQAKAYANQTGTNTQNVIANAGSNPYFGAAANMSPSAYQVNPNDTVTFGENGPAGTSTGSGFQVSNPIPASALNTPPASGSGATRSTQPVATNSDAQSVAQSAPMSTSDYLQSAGIPQTTNQAATPISGNPFSSGSKNTQAALALLGI